MELDTSCRPMCLLKPIKTHDTAWEPHQQRNSFKVTLNTALDGCIVPTETGAARVDYSHLVVLDNFLDQPTRQALIDYLTEPGWTTNSTCTSGGGSSSSHPPESKWEQATCDAADKPTARTWGLTSSVLQQFAAEDVPAKLEVQSRLAKLYPDMIIAHMPSEHIQLGLVHQQEAQLQELSGAGQQQQQLQQQLIGRQAAATNAQRDAPAVAADCSTFLANAAVYGDNYSWHVDADPSTFPSPSPWTQAYGNYCNREPGKPLLFSLLLYLDQTWPLDHDAETLFLDSMTDTGVFVRPKACRAVLMDQDIAHRLSAPSAAAGRPRYSLVWKLVMLPKQAGGSCSLARPEWGPPTYFGSAADVRQAAIVAAGRKRQATDALQEH